MIDLNTLESGEIATLNRLREPGVNKIIKILQDQLEGTKSKLVHAREMDVIHRLQGRAEAFEDLLRAIHESQKVNK